MRCRCHHRCERGGLSALTAKRRAIGDDASTLRTVHGASSGSVRSEFQGSGIVRRADEMVNTESNHTESNHKDGKGRANIPMDESRSPSPAFRFSVVALVVRTCPRRPPHLHHCCRRESVSRRVQAHSADGAVVAQTVLGFRSVVAGKDNGDVVMAKEGRAGRIHAAGKPTHRVANDRWLRWHGDRSSRGGRYTGRIHDDRERRRGNDGIVDSVDHLPVDQVRGLRVADVVERVRVSIDAAAAGEKQTRTCRLRASESFRRSEPARACGGYVGGIVQALQRPVILEGNAVGGLGQPQIRDVVVHRGAERIGGVVVRPKRVALLRCRQAPSLPVLSPFRIFCS